MLNEEELTKAVEAFCNALPAGQTFYAMHALPRVGFGDMEAKPVMLSCLPKRRRTSDASSRSSIGVSRPIVRSSG